MESLKFSSTFRASMVSIYNYNVCMYIIMFIYICTPMSFLGLAEDYKHPTSNRVLSELQQLFAAEATIVCQPYQSLADIVLAHYELQPPTNVQEGLLVYFVLTNSL